MTDSKNTRDANPAASPLPTAQDAGQAPLNPNVQTRPPEVQPPLTSATGQAFNAPDAGTSLPENSVDAGVGNPGPMVSAAPTDHAPRPQPGNIDRDALAGAEAGPGSQAGAEAVSSPGPVSRSTDRTS